MNSLVWLGFSAIVLLSWGAMGVFQKRAMEHLTPATALAWAAIGFMFLQPFLVPHGSPFEYSMQNLCWAVLNGIFNGLGFLSLMAAMHRGGKASIVEPLSAATYPVLFVLLAPVVLQENIRPIHAAGIACAVVGGMLLSTEKRTT